MPRVSFLASFLVATLPAALAATPEPPAVEVTFVFGGRPPPDAPVVLECHATAPDATVCARSVAAGTLLVWLSSCGGDATTCNPFTGTVVTEAADGYGARVRLDCGFVGGVATDCTESGNRWLSGGTYHLRVHAAPLRTAAAEAPAPPTGTWHAWITRNG